MPATDPVRVTLAELIALNAAQPLPLGGRATTGAGHGGRISAVPGRGMEYAESRHYEPGDDPRTLDWRVTARTGRTHTKLFREERERPVLLWVDYRPGMFFATRGAYKAVLAARAAALLAWSARQHGDRVGGAVFGGGERQEVRPALGTRPVLQLLRLLASPPQTPIAAPLDGALERLGRGVRPGSLIFCLSDFRGLGERGEGELCRLARHSDIRLVLFADPLERELPPPGLYPVGDARRQWTLDSGDRRLAADYRQRFAARLQRLQALRRPRLQLLACATTDDPAALLRRALAGG